MWIIIAIFTASAGIALLEVPSLLKKRLTKELYVFSFILIFGMALSISQVLQIEIPSPLKFLEAIYSPISDRIFSLLE